MKQSIEIIKKEVRRGNRVVYKDSEIHTFDAALEIGILARGKRAESINLKVNLTKHNLEDVIESLHIIHPSLTSGI